MVEEKEPEIKEKKQENNEKSKRMGEEVGY